MMDNAMAILLIVDFFKQLVAQYEGEATEMKCSGVALQLKVQVLVFETRKAKFKTQQLPDIQCEPDFSILSVETVCA